MKIDVEKLNDALAFVKPGLTPNPCIVAAGTISVLIRNGVMYFVTAPQDGDVKYQTKVCVVPEEKDCSIAIDGFQFSQAVSTCSEGNIDISIGQDTLTLDNGRGPLNFSIIIDDDDQPVYNDLGEVTGTEIKVSNTELLKLVTSCISTTMDNIAIRNIYCNKGVILASDLVNIAKGPEVLGEEILVTGRMKEFLLKYPDCKVLVSDDAFTMVSGDKQAIFTKDFQGYIDEFPVDALKAEFEQKKLHSFTVDMDQFLNALRFLSVATNSVNDYAVQLKAIGPTAIQLESEYGSKQTLPVTWLTPESGEWEVSFDCMSAINRFSFVDGIRQIDVYESQIACVGPVEISIGLITED